MKIDVSDVEKLSGLKYSILIKSIRCHRGKPIHQEADLVVSDSDKMTIEELGDVVTQVCQIPPDQWELLGDTWFETTTPTGGRIKIVGEWGLSSEGGVTPGWQRIGHRLFVNGEFIGGSSLGSERRFPEIEKLAKSLRALDLSQREESRVATKKGQGVSWRRRWQEAEREKELAERRKRITSAFK